MAIDYILLTDTFGQWVVTTNEIIDAINANFDLASLQTTDKSSLVAAINELYNTKYDKVGGPITGNVTISGTLSSAGDVSIGENGGGDTCLLFYDDTANTYRSICWDASSQKWTVEDDSGVTQDMFHSGKEISLGVLVSDPQNTQLRFKSGTEAENDAYTGSSGEFTFDTDTNTIRVHDGSTAGGVAIGQFNFDIDSFAVEATLSDADKIVFSDQSDSGTEKATTLNALATYMENNMALNSLFDIDSLPAGVDLAAADLIAFSDSGTEKSLGAQDFADALIGLSTLSLSLKNIQSFTSSGTYTATAGTGAVMVIVTGGGASPSGGGGSNGGTSSFGAFCSATGGVYNTTSSFGGTGGSGSGGVLNIKGGGGGGGSPSFNTNIYNFGGIGGSSFWGGGGAGGANIHGSGYGGDNGEAFGSGAGGASQSGGGGAGGTSIDVITSGFDGTSVTVGGGGSAGGISGRDGVVVVFEFG